LVALAGLQAAAHSIAEVVERVKHLLMKQWKVFMMQIAAAD
jgi:hypothetical protein